jgi:hypothetical protein
LPASIATCLSKPLAISYSFRRKLNDFEAAWVDSLWLQLNSDETPPKLIATELDDNILTIEFGSIISNTRLSKNRFKVIANCKKLKVKSVSVEDNDESFVNLAVQPKWNNTIGLQSEIPISYKDPKRAQMKQVIEDLLCNDL